MEGSHNVNWNSIIYRKRAIHRTERTSPFLAVIGFNTNLGRFLPCYDVIIIHIMLLLVTCTSALLWAWFPTCTDMHLKWFHVHKILCRKIYNLRGPVFYRYYFGRCSFELAELVSLLYSQGSSSPYSGRSHDFSVTILRCYKDIVYVNSFLNLTVRPWNSLPIERFPLT